MRRGTTLFLSALFAIAPFVFGIVRLLGPHADMVVLWMALASGVTTALVYAASKTRPEINKTGVALLALVLATSAGALASFRAGATGAPGVWAVATVIGICWALSLWLRAAALR